jgi:hypothetical protein
LNGGCVEICTISPLLGRVGIKHLVLFEEHVPETQGKLHRSLPVWRLCLPALCSFPMFYFKRNPKCYNNTQAKSNA